MNKIGFIGAGIMGQGMVQNLLKGGNEVSIIANKNRRPIEALVALGAKEMVSLTDIPISAWLTITSTMVTL